MHSDHRGDRATVMPWYSCGSGERSHGDRCDHCHSASGHSDHSDVITVGTKVTVVTVKRG